MPDSTKTDPEIKILQNFEVKNAEKSEKVGRMEDLIHDFFRKI